MKKRRLLFCIIILFGAAVAQAENGSFMGKRFILNMGASFSPAWNQPGVFHDEVTGKSPWYSFNYTLSPNIEFIAWKLGTIGVSYHYFKTKYEYEYFVEDEDPFNESFSWGKWKSASEDLITHGFGLYYKQYFTSRARAPMGSFIKFQLDGFFFKHPDKHNSQTMTNSNLFALKFEVGRDFLFFNRLRFSTGLSLGIPFGGYRAIFDSFKTVPMSDIAKRRILGHYWLGFTVNIGFLAF